MYFFLFLGLLKRALKRRSDLKIIISSATLEEKKFKEFFNFGKEVPLFKVDGQSYEVEKIYSPRTEQDYLIGVVDTVIQINHREQKGMRYFIIKKFKFSK